MRYLADDAHVTTDLMVDHYRKHAIAPRILIIAETTIIMPSAGGILSNPGILVRGADRRMYQDPLFLSLLAIAMGPHFRFSPSQTLRPIWEEYVLLSCLLLSQHLLSTRASHARVVPRRLVGYVDAAFEDNESEGKSVC